MKLYTVQTEKFFRHISTRDLKEHVEKYTEKCTRCKWFDCPSSENCWKCDNGQDRFIEKDIARALEDIEFAFDMFDKCDIQVKEVFPRQKMVRVGNIEAISQYLGIEPKLTQGHVRMIVHNGIHYTE